MHVPEIPSKLMYMAHTDRPLGSVLKDCKW